MLSDSMTRMLILQDRDMKLQQIEALLLSIPLERKAGLARIEGHKGRIEASRQKMRELETRAKSIEMDLGSAEAQIIKYKNQQLQVKKNEEYLALTHEIALTERRISELESDELEILYELDASRLSQKEEERVIQSQIESESASLARLDEKEKRVQSELDGARSAQEEAEAALDNPTRAKYRQVARGLKFPIVVALSDHKCGGCHMRVSNAVDSDVRAQSEITTCDNCGRILYYAL